MRNVIGPILLLVFVTQYSLAETPADSYVPNHQIDRLQLSDEQADLVKQILSVKREKQKNLMRDIRPRMEAINKETREQLAAILSEDQLARYDETRKYKGNRRKEWRTQHIR